MIFAFLFKPITVFINDAFPNRRSYGQIKMSQTYNNELDGEIKLQNSIVKALLLLIVRK
jgi:hypothetical protein